MSAKQRRERILHLLASAYASHQQWQQVREKAVAQLQSMSNLAEQLATLRRCADGGRMGSLTWYPQLVSLLEARILTSFERALSYVHKASETLAEVCKRLRSLWKEAERLLCDIVALEGAETVLIHTPESFPLCDVTEWLRLLNAAHFYDQTEKQAALYQLSCTSPSVERACRAWEKQTDGLTDVLECTRYTLAQVNKSIKLIQDH